MSSTMRTRFAPFQRKTAADFTQIWSTAEFTFDANVLLNLYESPRVVAEQLGRYLTALADKFYLTDQVALEFYRNREKVIHQAQASLIVLKDIFSALPSAFSDTALADLAKIVDTEKKNLDSFLSDGDQVEKMLCDTVGDRIDPPCSDVIGLYEEIDRRYLAQVPPGFADLKEKDDYKKYGDAILWLQAINHQKKSKKPLILVTSDQKYDWWVKDNKDKIVGPRPELGHEIWEKAGVQFHLYTLKQFLEYAAVYFPSKVGNEKSGSDAIKVVEQMELEREVALQNSSEAPRFVEVTTHTSPLRDLSSHLLTEQERNSSIGWANSGLQETLWDLQSQLDRLKSTTIMSDPSPDSLYHYIKRLESYKRLRSPLDQLRSMNATNEARSQVAAANSMLNRVNSLYQASKPMSPEATALLKKSITSAIEAKKSSTKQPVFKKVGRK